MKSADSARRNSYLLIAALLLLGLGLAAVGYRHYIDQRSAIEAEVHKQLAAIADLKVRLVAEWRRERLGDASILSATQLTPSVQQVLLGKATLSSREQVLAWMRTICRASRYANAILLDRRSEVRLSVGRTGAEEHYAALARRVLATGEAVFSDLHYDSGLAGPHLGLSIPLRSSPQAQPEGVLLLGIDPSEYLYPRIQFWPTASRTGETLLVRREGNEVVFLNDLRYRKGAALNLRLTITDPTLPAARAALGFEGFADGLDYRGVRVLAAVRKVPDSPWRLVAKVDAAEVYAQIHQQNLWLALMLSAIGLATATAIGFAWHQARSRFYQEKYEAELEQKRSMALLDSVIEATSDAVYVKDKAGRYLMVNSAFARIAGVPREQIAGRDDTALFSPPVAKEIMDRDRRLMSGGSTETVEEKLPSPSTGETATYLTAKGPLLNDRGNVIGLFGIARDVTDQKRSEEERLRLQDQLQQAQKMESVGRLAGGVAHDFNNLLTVINGYASLVLAGLPEDSPLKASVAEIGKAGERAAALTRQLLAFSRKQIIEPKVLDLNGLVQDASRMLARMVGERIEVVTHVEPRVGYVQADPGQLHQVLMNLAVNARDAMPDGGTLTLETSSVVLDETYCREHVGATPGPYLLLAVSDTGCGMDEAIRARIFEPFFTTKKVGEGTGLGLATVFGIVKQSGGNIWVYSEPGRGTTFKIYLPEVGAPAGLEQAAPSAVSLRGTETVLVVEDQPGVRKLTAEILKGYGYGVLEVANGAEALLLSERFDNPIHAMITDVVMPGMTGRELASRLASLRPAMKVLYMSGYAEEVIARQGVLDSDVAFLSKPFTSVALAQKLRELLGDSKAPS
jgi:PAS domain S-box-containing protein